MEKDAVEGGLPGQWSTRPVTASTCPGLGTPSNCLTSYHSEVFATRENLNSRLANLYRARGGPDNSHAIGSGAMPCKNPRIVLSVA
jgi:hypothetical protein